MCIHIQFLIKYVENLSADNPGLEKSFFFNILIKIFIEYFFIFCFYTYHYKLGQCKDNLCHLFHTKPSIN